MNKTEWKNKQRAERLTATDNFGLKLKKLMTQGTPILPFRGNDHIWTLRNEIASEVELVKAKRKDKFDND
jgi:hypothetical protein